MLMLHLAGGLALLLHKLAQEGADLVDADGHVAGVQLEPLLLGHAAVDGGEVIHQLIEGKGVRGTGNSVDGYVLE